MDITKYYSECKGAAPHNSAKHRRRHCAVLPKGSDAAILLLLGSGGSNALTKGAAKWLVRRGVNVLSLGPEDGVVGYHSFPLERAEEAIAQLKARGVRKFGVLGASITSIPALSAAARTLPSPNRCSGSSSRSSPISSSAVPSAPRASFRRSAAPRARMSTAA